MTMTWNVSGAYLTPTSSYPPDGSLSFIATPADAEPAYLGTTVDSVTGWSLKKIYNGSNVGITYPVLPAYNRDETLLGLFLTSGSRVLLSLPDFAVVNASVSGDGRWPLYAGFNANYLIRHNTSNGRIYLFDPSDNTTKTTIIDLSGTYTSSTLEIMAHGYTDDAGQYLMVYAVRTSGSQKTLLCVDLINGTIRSTLDVIAKPHAALMCRCGLHYLTEWSDPQGTAGDEVGRWMHTAATGARLYQVDPWRAHSTFTYDQNSDCVVVSVPSNHPPVFDSNMYKYRSSDGTKTKVLTGVVAFQHGEIASAIDMPGWVWLSVYDTNTSSNPGTDQLVALKLDASETIRLYAFSHQNTTQSFGEDAFAQPNRDGTKLYLHAPTPWGNGTVGNQFMVYKP